MGVLFFVDVFLAAAKREEDPPLLFISSDCEEIHAPIVCHNL